ncbi:phosphatase PAP2 family protein [Methylobacterium sp. GC_Met_3]|uniref:phosphatase PAP2 family protein n=2 Tax=unclassified Methylobacterium TaxID=2615210 RepID=UPI00226AF4EF
MLGTLADAYANPIMVDALILEREGIVTNNLTLHAPALPAIDAPKQLERWEPWVRAYIAIGDLLQGIVFQDTPSGFRVSRGPDLIAQIDRPQRATFAAQIPLVLSWAELRSERATEIMAQIDPQYAFWSSVVYLHPDRTKRTFELINIVLQFCVYVEMRLKQALACWRPIEYSAQVQPMITTPGHGSFPSGHATQAHAVAYVLKVLLGLEPQYTQIVEQLDRQAARIATNRVIAGVHFPVDNMAGRMLGKALGEYIVGRCTGQVAFPGRTFVASAINSAPTTDFNPFNAAQTALGAPFYAHAPGGPIPVSPLMKHFWTRAHDEWVGRYP